MTFLELQTATKSFLADRADFTTAIAKEFINRAYQKMANSFQFYELDGTDESITTVDGTASYNTPSGVRSIRVIKITGDTEYEVIAQTMAWYERQDTTSDNKGLPEHYIRYGSKIFFWPTPDDAYEVRIRYLKDTTELSADADVPVFPEEWHELLFLSAASSACFQFGMAQRGMELKNEFLGAVTALQEETTMDSRHRIGQVRLQRTRRSHRLGYPDPDYAETP